MSDKKQCACDRVESWLEKNGYLDQLRRYYTTRNVGAFMQSFLERTPGVLGGKLRVCGTRLSVEFLLQQYHAYGGVVSFLCVPDYARIGDFPGIDVIDACLLAFIGDRNIIRENCLDCSR